MACVWSILCCLVSLQPKVLGCVLKLLLLLYCLNRPILLSVIFFVMVNVLLFVNAEAQGGLRLCFEVVFCNDLLNLLLLLPLNVHMDVACPSEYLAYISCAWAHFYWGKCLMSGCCILGISGLLQSSNLCQYLHVFFPTLSSLLILKARAQFLSDSGTSRTSFLQSCSGVLSVQCFLHRPWLTI